MNAALTWQGAASLMSKVLPSESSQLRSRTSAHNDQKHSRTPAHHSTSVISLWPKDRSEAPMILFLLLAVEVLFTGLACLRTAPAGHRLSQSCIPVTRLSSCSTSSFQCPAPCSRTSCAPKTGIPLVLCGNTKPDRLFKPLLESLSNRKRHGQAFFISDHKVTSTSALAPFRRS